MTEFDSNEQRRAVAAYRNARKAGKPFEIAYDSAVDAYCQRLNLPKSVRAQVDVGVLIAQAQRKYGRWIDGQEA